jgi:hypothetical protein
MLLMLPVAAQGDICVPGDTVTVTWTKATDSPPPNYTGPLPLPVRYKVFIGTNDIDRVEAGAYVTDLSFTFRPQEGIWQVWVMAEDYCGNSIFSLPSEVFKLDKTAPVWDSHQRHELKSDGNRDGDDTMSSVFHLLKYMSICNDCNCKFRYHVFLHPNAIVRLASEGVQIPYHTIMTEPPCQSRE